MKKISRRDFLKLVGGGSAAAAVGAMLPQVGLLTPASKEAFTFRAVAGLPGGILPSYASYVVQGGVNLATQTGVITKNLFAGPPEAASTFALPGLARIVRVTTVREMGSTLEILGTVDDPSVLFKGESSKVQIKVDKSAGTVKTPFIDEEIELKLQ